jgi:hypothetical protein
VKSVTRHVIADLWPLYLSGNASEDTRQLVEGYLYDDPEFARTLGDAPVEVLPRLGAPSITPGHQLRRLALMKRRLAGPFWLLLLALAATGMAFGRIVSDTSFNVSPRKFIATAAVAVVSWIAFLVRLYQSRRDVPLRLRR